MQDKKARFLKAYSQVPDILKNQIVVMINSKPYTWDSIYFEVKDNTPLSKKILNTLSNMNII